MDLAAIVRRLDVTRARIEAEVPAPGIIAVTSAVRGDGKSLVATGIAYGLSAVGHRVLLIDGDAQAVHAGGVGSAPKLDGRAEYSVSSYIVAGSLGEPSRLGLSSPGVVASASGESVRATFAQLRERFAYIVIDTSVLIKSGMALVFVNEADGVVIALKQSRGALDADRELIKVLHASGTPVLGVVTSQPKTIKDFASDAASLGRSSGVRLRTGDDATKSASSLGIRVH